MSVARTRRFMLSCALFGLCALATPLAANAAPDATATPAAVATPEPAATLTPVPDPTPVGDQLADLAETEIGAPYVWGGTSPSGFDCTGFVLWTFAQFGISLPHNEYGQLTSGPQVDAEDLQPGDVLVFANTYRAGLSHTGIYIGDGEFVHAADESHGVMVSSLWDSYWAPRLVGASRPEDALG